MLKDKKIIDYKRKIAVIPVIYTLLSMHVPRREEREVNPVFPKFRKAPKEGRHLGY